MNRSTLYPTKKYDLVLRSAVVRSEKPTKGLEAALAPNENQANRLTGFFSDGTAVVVADPAGKRVDTGGAAKQGKGGNGGMDFNKLLGGKIFAVAADACMPVFEKDGKGERTKDQKKENDRLLFSTSGLYMLSSKDYPALTIVEGYTHLIDRGEKVLLLSEEQLAAKEVLSMTSDMDWELALTAVEALLGDERNLMAAHDDAINRKRQRGIDDAKRDAEDAEETYSGVEFKKLAVSQKDGNPIVVIAYRIGNGPVKSTVLSRETKVTDANGRETTEYQDKEDTVMNFGVTPEASEIAAALQAGTTVTFGFAQGHLMRTSQMFRRKLENVRAIPVGKPRYGDAVYVDGALNGWVSGIVSIIHSMHPNFPGKDYDAHHYVAACRQREIGMMKSEGKYSVPEALSYDIAAAILK